MRTAVLLLCLVLGGAGPRSQGAETRDSAAPSPKADLIIVGSGISGLAAALDAGRAGANVTVIDMWSVFGGHAVMSGGLVCLVDTPYQRERHIADSSELAVRDFLTHGKDANPDWVRLYAHDSKRERAGLAHGRDARNSDALMEGGAWTAMFACVHHRESTGKTVRACRDAASAAKTIADLPGHGLTSFETDLKTPDHACLPAPTLART